MTDRQRMILVDAFRLIAGGARTGKRKAQTETASAVLEHVAEMQAMLTEVRKGLEGHIGADSVLKRAKPLSTSRPR